MDVSEIGKVKSVDWHHVGVLQRDLGDLLAYGQRVGFKKEFAAWHTHIKELKQRHKLDYDRASDLIQPYAVIEEINKITAGQAIIATGVGQHQMWAAQYFDYREPRLWLTSGSMGTMGFGLPAAIGAQFAQPDRLVIDIDGDASMRMNIGGAGDGHNLQASSKGDRPQQLWRRNGPPVAKVVLPRSDVGQR